MPGSFRVPLRARRFAVLLALLPAGAWAADPQITSLTASPNPVTAGAATDTVLTLTVPSGTSFVSATPVDANCAATVRDELVRLGVDPARISTSARDDGTPVVDYSARGLSQAALRECLLPDRRVDVQVRATPR